MAASDAMDPMREGELTGEDSSDEAGVTKLSDADVDCAWLA